MKIAWPIAFSTERNSGMGRGDRVLRFRRSHRAAPLTFDGRRYPPSCLMATEELPQGPGIKPRCNDTRFPICFGTFAAHG